MQPELDAATATISAILHQVTALTRRVDPDAEARQLVAPDEVVGGPRRGSFDRPLRQLDPRHMPTPENLPEALRKHAEANEGRLPKWLALSHAGQHVDLIEFVHRQKSLENSGNCLTAAFTRRGSQVQSLSHPPSLSTVCPHSFQRPLRLDGRLAQAPRVQLSAATAASAGFIDGAFRNSRDREAAAGEIPVSQIRKHR
jgi:hypothetical protein